jgi:multidrug efflux pump subunit AcrA (membrane-fusion protein)
VEEGQQLYRIDPARYEADFDMSQATLEDAEAQRQGAQALATLAAGWLLFQFSWEWLLYATMPALLLLMIALAWQRFRNTAITKPNGDTTNTRETG